PRASWGRAAAGITSDCRDEAHRIVSRLKTPQPFCLQSYLQDDRATARVPAAYPAVLKRESGTVAPTAPLPAISLP
ncbi:hypothetical protein ACG9ZE_23050, partial [Acinetobacter sp. ULE_I053]|uniref:hypothetical protein n=1 Tax=Acinetobacter sp. ULE_I053 TaxID=3373069 RepID=UPI003AF636F9